VARRTGWCTTLPLALKHLFNSKREQAQDSGLRRSYSAATGLFKGMAWQTNENWPNSDSKNLWGKSKLGFGQATHSYLASSSNFLIFSMER